MKLLTAIAVLAGLTIGQVIEYSCMIFDSIYKDSICSNSEYVTRGELQTAGGSVCSLYVRYGFKDSLEWRKTGDNLELDPAVLGSTDPDAFHHDSPDDSTYSLYATDLNVGGKGDVLALHGNLQLKATTPASDSVVVNDSTTFVADYGLQFQRKDHTTRVGAGGIDFPAFDGFRLYSSTDTLLIAASSIRGNPGGYVVIDSVDARVVIADTLIGPHAASTVANKALDSANAAIAAAAQAQDSANFALLGVVPVGAVIDWYGDSTAIPAGWVLCDGTAKYKNAAGDSALTPPLMNMLTIGACNDSAGLPAAKPYGTVPRTQLGDTTHTHTFSGTGVQMQHTLGGGTPFQDFSTTPMPTDNYVDHDYTPAGTNSSVTIYPKCVAVWKLIRSRTW